MRRNFKRVVALLAPAVLAYAVPAWAQYSAQPTPAVQASYYEGSDGGGRYLPVGETKAASPQPMSATSGGSCGCATGGCNTGCSTCNSCCCDGWEGCNDGACRDLVLFSGFESWHGYSDGSFNGNNGALTGFNFGQALSQEYGIGAQFGASYGVYDWSGRSSGAGGQGETDEAQEQLFITTGFFRKADACSRWSAGLVYDISINNNFGVFSNEPYLTQWRGQFGYALDAHNEIGVWGTLRDHGFSQNSIIQTVGPVRANVTFHAVDQTNIFWHHKFDQGADSYVWFGFPDGQSKLGPDGGSLGDYIFGGSVTAPMSDRWALYANVQYMHPSAAPGATGSSEETWDVGFGLVFYPGCNARTSTVSGSAFAPLQGVANNGSFMVDSNLHQ